MLWQRKGGRRKGGRRKGAGKPHRKFQQRAAQVRRRPWKAAGVLALVLALIGGLVFLVGYSRAFVVEDVVVEGTDGELAGAVVDAAAIPAGRPLARVDAGGVEERVLADLRVEELAVKRSWPDAITLQVTPREAAIVVHQGREGPQVADAKGVVFDSVDSAPKELPEVRIPDDGVEPEHLAGVLELLAALPEDLRGDVSQMRLLADGVVQFKLGTMTVKWGATTQPDLKSRVLAALLQQESIDPTEEVQPITVDLHAPETPVVTGMPVAEDED